jgi:hypothetical protein
MSALIPYRFLFRVAYPCRYLPGVPLQGDELLDLPESCRLDALPELDGRPRFAELRLAWNEGGLAVQCEVRGKEQEPVGDEAKPLLSDRVSIWVDTRDSRTSHRASRYCVQVHFLPTGGGPEKDEPVAVPMKINRALQDAPLPDAEAILYRCKKTATGYRIEAFLPAAALNGFDPEQHPRLGFSWLVRDQEKGEQALSVGSDFPVAEDPSLWSVLELVRPPAAEPKPEKPARRRKKKDAPPTAPPT